MRRAHFIVAIGADQQQVAGVRVREQMLYEHQARGVDPLQVIQEEHQRMLLAREHRDELPKHHAEPVLRFGRGQRRYGRLLADDQLYLGQHIDDELAVDTDRRLNPLAPAGDACFAFGQQLRHQFAKRLGQCGVGNVTLVLIELAGNEIAVPCDDRLAQCIDQRRLADSGVPGDGRQLRLAGCGHAVECGEEHRCFRFTSVQLVRDLEALRNVFRAERERLDTA